MDLRETGLGGVDWIRLAQDRGKWRAVVSAVMNIRVLAPRSLVTAARMTMLFWVVTPCRLLVTSLPTSH
jgi:hypothetical protein